MRPLIGVVEHDDHCPPGLLGRWLAEAGATLEVRRPATGDDLPELDGPGAVDALLVLGGPMDAWDDAHHHWLEPTRQLIRDAADRGLPTLGVCLGHQLCALAFGGSVGRSPRGQQVGMTTIGWNDQARSDALLGPVARSVANARGVHWNDDQVLVLPDGASVLAATEAGDLQAVRFAESVWGVQWHPEVDETLVAPWAAQDADRHRGLGIDQPAVLTSIGEARDELARTWRGLAESFVSVIDLEGTRR